MNSPILIVGFNRPDKLISNLDRISKWAVPHIYISIDGPTDESTKDITESIKIYLLFISKWKILFYSHLYIAIMSIKEGNENIKYVVDIAGKFVKIINAENIEQDQKLNVLKILKKIHKYPHLKFY